MKLDLIMMILIIFLAMGISTCDRYEGGPDVKIYVSKPDIGGIVRGQAEDEDKKIILYKNTRDYRCMSKEDFDTLLFWCLTKDN